MLRMFKTLFPFRQQAVINNKKMTAHLHFGLTRLTQTGLLFYCQLSVDPFNHSTSSRLSYGLYYNIVSYLYCIFA